MTRPWGLLPEDVRENVLRREWQNDASLKARLLGEKPFPLRIGLKPPAGNAVLDDLGHFQVFVKAWRDFPAQELIEWRIKSYRTISHQEVPTHFSIASVDQLLDFIGEDALIRRHRWETNMEPLLGIDARLYPALVKHLNTLETMATADAISLAKLIPQLTPGMGAGCYFRALPVTGVDTKFLETHAALITDILDHIHHGEISEQGGLSLWLECLDNPKGWLTVRPLCPAVKERMGGFAIMQLPVDVLRSYALPALNILVIENKQSGYHLPDLPDTVAVFGGGRNVSWMDGEWLTGKNVGYWGDIDSWGLTILSDARALLPSIVSLMMDMDTLETHSERTVTEPVAFEKVPANLNAEELIVFNRLVSDQSNALRLEQEKLDAAHITYRLQSWLNRSLRNFTPR